jgi:hypothetical protein
MDRVLRGTVATASIVFYLDGVSTAPAGNAATVTITRADGSLVTEDEPAVHGTAGEFSHTFTADETGALDCLTLDWTASFAVGGPQTLTTRVEVVGGYLFSVSDARRDPDLADEADYPVEAIVEARTTAEQALERACGIAFVPRYTRETLSGNGRTVLALAWPAIRRFRDATVDGATLGELPTVVGSRAYRSGLWTAGFSNVTLGYEHGLDEPEGEVSRACLRLAKHILVDSPQDDRALRIDTESGSMLISTPGMRGQRFGIPEVDAVVQAHARYPAPMLA